MSNSAPATSPSKAQAHEATGRAPLRELISTGCRLMAHTGLAPTILGHLSVRTSPDELFIRCRGPQESGLAYTDAADVHLVPMSGPAELGGWSAPNELPIHTSILRHRPDVTAVVHAHPAPVVTMSIARLDWLPIVGAYDIPATRLAAGGIPVWERSVLVNTTELGDDLARCLADRPVAVLYGHGLVCVGRGSPEHAVAEAIVNAIAVTSLAEQTLAVRATGREPAPIPADDLAQLPDLGSGLNVETMWRFLTRELAESSAARTR